MAKPVHHLYHRAAFGLPLQHIQSSNSFSSHVQALLHKSEEKKQLNVVPKPEMDINAMRGNNENQVKERIEKSREEIIQLNSAWVRRMGSSEAALLEKMTFFWHDHFACRSPVAFLAQQQNNTIREHALGSFRKLAEAVSKDPAMLQFLNNQQNRKESPNENFARELMELFTLGKGHYTEEDIKNAARAFTGWGFDRGEGQFVFRQRAHDEGVKTFRGKSGNFNGDDILEMVLDDRQTARFITEKIWSFFVSTELQDEEIITDLAKKFFESDYQIGKLMQFIFSSDWFYDSKYVANRIKSPIELLAGILVQTGGSFTDEKSAVFPQRALGQVLFNPPSVGGWPQGTGWIDSSSLIFRMSLPTVLFRGIEPSINAKDDGDANNLTNGIRKGKISFSADWGAISKHFSGSFETIEDYLLEKPTTDENRKLILQFASTANDEREFTQRAFTGLMSLPEYQLS